MYKNLRWKILTCLAVFVIFSAVGVYPIFAQRYGLPAPSWLMSKQLQLGLDLKGGVHLVLRVNRDDALKLTSETLAEQLRESLQSAGVTVGSIAVSSPTAIHIEGVPGDKDTEFGRVADEASGSNYSRSGSGGNYDLTMNPNIIKDLREQTMVQAQETIDRR